MLNLHGRHGASKHADETARGRKSYCFTVVCPLDHNMVRSNAPNIRTRQMHIQEGILHALALFVRDEELRLLASGAELALRNMPAPGLLFKKDQDR